MAVTDLPTPPKRETAFGVRMRRWRDLLKTLLSNPTTFIGFLIIFLLLAMAIFAPFLAPPNVPDPYQMPRDWGATRMQPGTPGFPLGTTNQGGDVLYGVIWGSRTSLQLSVIVVSVTVVIGIAIGSIAGLVGGWIDETLMRIVDVFLSIPELIFALAVAAILGPSFTNIILSLCIVFWVKYARIMRAQIILIRQADYVQAARVIGDTKLSIFFKDMLPNASTPIAVQATLDMGNIVLVGATLSFIGLAESGIAEWGVLVSEGQAGIASGRWWASTFPGLMIFLWALAFNLVGDGLRDALDPRTEDKR
jgi:peptide/nickel transport system permease protein